VKKNHYNRYLLAYFNDIFHDSKPLAELIRQRNAEVVILSLKNAKTPRDIDKNLYKDRNKIERFFGRMKQHRRIATRYDKTAVSYLSFVYVAAGMILLLGSS